MKEAVGKVVSILGAVVYFVLLLVMMVASAPRCSAQEVRIVNFGGQPYAGWVRTVTDIEVDATSGVTKDGDLWVLGREVGRAGRVVDVRTKLPAWRGRSVSLTDSKPTEIPVFGADEVLGLVGAPRISGVELKLASTSVGGRPNPLQDGAGFVVHWAGRPLDDKLLHVDVWVTFYPDQPWAVGEVVFCASNPELPGIRFDVSKDITLAWSNALSVVDGLSAGAAVLHAGDWFVDGQARSFRFVNAYLSKLQVDDVASALIASANAVVANGIQTPGPLGAVAESEPPYDARPWVIEHFETARANLHGWAEAKVGVAAKSTQTGAQEDQGFSKGSRAYAPYGIGAEAVRYYAALGQSRRPSHHLDADGTHLDLTGHPQLVIWDGRPHWHTGVSPDRLGKAETLSTGWRSHNWHGPDRQHWFINSLAFAAEVTASPALQWQLEHHVAFWVYQETVDPRLSTSRPDAARSQGWAGIVATQLWHVLEDRAKAEVVKARFQARAREVYLPFYQGNAWQLWDVQQDPRVMQYVDAAQFPSVSMVYQSAFATMGVQIAAEVFEMPVLAREAFKQALKITEAAWTPDPALGLRGWEILGVRADGTLTDQPAEGFSAHSTGWFQGAWLPCAAWTVLRHQPDHELAQRVYVQATAGASPNDWMPPR